MLAPTPFMSSTCRTRTPPRAHQISANSCSKTAELFTAMDRNFGGGGVPIRRLARPSPPPLGYSGGKLSAAGVAPYTSAESHRQVGPAWKYPPASPLTCGTGLHRNACVGNSGDLTKAPATVTSQSLASTQDSSMGRSSVSLLVGLLLLRFNWCLAVHGGGVGEVGGVFPMVVSTWPFREAVRAAWDVVSAGDGGGSAVDAVVAGCSACEVLRCDGTVGPGGSPDENGETTLDALIMNGATMEIGAVAAMRYVKDGIKAAKLVMEHSLHTLLVGEKATDFAISMGLPGPINLSSPESLEKWANWRQNHCQPNFWKNVAPVDSCGPYHPINLAQALDSAKHEVEWSQGGVCQERFQSDSLLEPIHSHLKFIDRHNHDTISMAVIDKMGHVAVGTSTNGATFKIPGRVGDGPIPGSSSYGDDEVGACGASGDGDIMMRFLPCYQVVESMRQGMEPRDAAMDAISRIARKFPNFVGAVFAVNKKGVHAGACHGWTFQYSVRNSSMHDVEVITVYP